MSEESRAKPAGAGRVILLLLLVAAVVPGGAYLAFRQSVLSSAVETVRTARKHLTDGDTTAARQSVEWLRHFDPTHQGAMLIEAASRQAEGGTDEAAKLIQEINPDSLELPDRIMLAGLLEAANKLDSAEAALLPGAPDSAEAIGPLVRLYIKELRIPDAIKLYKAHWQSNKNDRATLLSLLELITANPSSDAYVAELKRIDQVEPNQKAVTLALATAASERGDNKEARQRFEAALKLAPNDVRTRLLAARFFVDLGETENAGNLLAFEKSEVPETEDQFWYLQSRLAESEGRKQDALAYLEHALELFPHSEAYLQLKSRLLRSTGRIEDAIKVTQQTADFATARQELEQLYGQASNQRFSTEFCTAIADRLELMQYTEVAKAWRAIAD